MKNCKSDENKKKEGGRGGVLPYSLGADGVVAW